MLRRLAITRGTPEEMTMPSMSSSQLRRLAARKPWNMTACSSAVRSAWVAMRQWSISPSSAAWGSVTDRS